MTLKIEEPMTYKNIKFIRTRNKICVNSMSVCHTRTSAQKFEKVDPGLIED